MTPKRLQSFRKGLRQLNALKQHRQFLLFLSVVVPLNQGVLVYFHQVHGCSFHYHAVSKHKLIFVKDQRPSRKAPLSFFLETGVNCAKPDEDGLHQTAVIRPLSGYAACTQRTSGCALYSKGVSGPLWCSEAPAQQSLLVPSCIHFTLLVSVIQLLPKPKNGVGFPVGQAENCVTPELLQMFPLPVQMLKTRYILVVNSLLKNTKNNCYIK